MRLLACFAALALGLALSCYPSPLDETGKRCSAERPCGGDYACLGEVCVRLDQVVPDGGPDAGPDGGPPDAGPDAGPPDAGPDAGVLVNLLVNPGFEQLSASKPVGWRVNPSGILGTRVGGHSGARAGRVLSDAVGSSRVDLQACKLEYSIVSPK